MVWSFRRDFDHNNFGVQNAYIATRKSELLKDLPDRGAVSREFDPAGSNPSNSNSLRKPATILYSILRRLVSLTRSNLQPNYRSSRHDARI